MANKQNAIAGFAAAPGSAAVYSGPSVPSEYVVPLLHYGECMANICCNLKEHDSLPENIRQALARCHRQWDLARRPATEELRRQEPNGPDVRDRYDKQIAKIESDLKPPNAQAERPGHRDVGQT